MEISIDLIKRVFSEKGYMFFNGERPYNVNIIGIRTGYDYTNKFDDTLIVIFNDDNGDTLIKKYPITTDAGNYYVKNPIRSKGTAILVPNQYKGVWGISKHKGRYWALCQKMDKKFKVWRDNNKDMVIDCKPDTLQEGIYGINLHRSSKYNESNTIDRWSASCQVFKRKKDFDEAMAIFVKSYKMYGNSFTYTLLEQKDLINASEHQNIISED